jgi:hypothetical protein
MPDEPLGYRARKWAVQSVSTRLSRPTQLDRLSQVDWDVVVVLDACRWDALDAAADWPIDSAVSPGSATDEWLGVVSQTDVFADAYVATGNVKYDFFDVGAAETAHLWRTDWHADLGTVLPDPVLDRADGFLDDGDRPVVAHVMPPHAPYVARVGDTWLPAYPQTSAWSHVGVTDAENDTMSAQVAMASGQIDIDRAKTSYEASVESAWNALVPYLSDWVERGLDVVVTADHGEVFGRPGELGLYGHPNRCHIDPLVRVPFERLSRPLATDDDAAGSVEQKLQALGYAE